MIGVALFELIIIIHEFGHYIVAKKSGVRVLEFSIGMGKKLFGFKKGETLYSVRLFPIGGFCAMEGEDEVNGNPRSAGESADQEDGVKTITAGSEISDDPEQQDPAAAVSVTSDESSDNQIVYNDSRSFYNAKIWKRMLIIIAGAVMNILLGMLLMVFTLLPQKNFVSTQVSEFAPGSFSSVTGLQSGDTIVNINGYAVNTSTDFSFALFTLPVSEVDGSELSVYKEDCAFDLYAYCAQNITQDTSQEDNAAMVKLLQEAQTKLADTADKKEAYTVFCAYYDKLSVLLKLDKPEQYPEIELRETRKRYRTDMTVIRDGERVELQDVDLLTTVGESDDKPTLNIDFYVEPLEKPFGSVITETFSQTVSVVRMVWGSLVGLVTGRFGLHEMSGPIGIASAITTVASESLKTSGFGSAVSSIVYIMMVISINLGVVNMLPFPALDGGRFLLLLFQAIFRRPVPRKVEGVINTVGFVLIIGLSVAVAVSDVIKLIFGG